MDEIICISQISDSEKELVQQHINNCNTISWETIQLVWRDTECNLCIKYAAILGYPSQWYHYNVEKREWW